MSWSPTTLRDLDLDVREAFSVALANLRTQSGSSFKELAPGLFASEWRDGQDASRLLVPDLITALPVKGDPVAMVPERGTLLVSGAGDNPGLLAMASAAAEVLSTREQALSSQAVRLCNGRWADFAPDPAELNAFHDLRRGQWIREYAEQKQLFGQLHAQGGESIFVADYAPMQDKRSGRVFCLTFWADGVPTLLPRADVIVFKATAEVLLVPWAAAIPIVGHRMAPVGYYPIRYRTETFPDAVEIEGLRAVATLAKPVQAK